MAGKSLSPDDITGKLLQGSFTRSGPAVDRLADPVAPTAMVLTIEDMIPYEHNPRKMTNSKYEELKESIRARGLDQPPPVTRRPGEQKYIIRNGGNTRLQILKELWNETKDDRFFRVNVLFRPWDGVRGEIIALTGHLAENDLQGQLMFIERAVGIEHAKTIYEQELGKAVSQSELSRLLTADGYPISQPHLSKMQDAIRVLLPAIPTTLYSGLGKHQVERLLSLRKSAALTWEGIIEVSPKPQDFESMFQDVLSQFDSEASEFVFERFQDELIGNMKAGTPLTYEKVLLDITEHQGRARRSAPIDASVYIPLQPIRVDADPMPLTAPGLMGSQQPGSTLSESGVSQQNTVFKDQPTGVANTSEQRNAPKQQNTPSVPSAASPSEQPLPPTTQEVELSEEEKAHRIAAHVVTPVATTSRVQGIKQQLAALDGEILPDFNSNALVSIPVQAGGLHPISDIWYIERILDWPEEIRRVNAQLAREIAEVSDLGGQYVLDVGAGIGFVCNEPPEDAELSETANNTLTLLQALSGVFAIALSASDPANPLDTNEFAFTAALGNLLIGQPAYDSNGASVSGRISDAAIVKLFRLIRLARRLVELEVAQSEGVQP